MMIPVLFVLACTRSDDVDLPTVPTNNDPCAAGPIETWESNEAPSAVVDGFVSEMNLLGAEGVAWAVLQDGEIRYAGAAGFKDDGVPMDPMTLFRTGSTLKMQTAAAALVQADRGALDLHAPISDVLPEFSMAAQPGLAESATTHDLLTHQGGFYDYTPIDGPHGDNALYNHTHNAFANSYYLLAPPGNFFNYSNPNFSIAGLVAQEAAGVPFRTLIDDTVWTPLCMDRTFIDAEDVLADGDFARATTRDWETGVGSVRVGPESYDHGFSAPAGFAWSSTGDMLRFADFVLDGNPALMSDELSEALSTPHVDMADYPGAAGQYGYGLMIESGLTTLAGWRPTEVWRHGGVIPGYSADLVIHPESGTAVAVLSNSDGAFFSNSIGRVLNTLTDLPPPEEFDVGIDPERWSTFEGTYVDDFNVGTFHVSVVDGELRVDAPDLDAFGVPYEPVLEPFARDTFLFTVQGFTVSMTFIDGEQSAQWMRSRIFVLERTADPTPASLDIDRDRLDRLQRLDSEGPSLRR